MNKKKIILSLLIIFILTCFSGNFEIFANSQKLKNLLEENNKINSELQKIWEEKISLKTQLNFLDKKLEQLFIEKKIFLEKKQEFQKDLEEKISEKSDIKDLSQNSWDDLKNFIRKINREEKKWYSNWKENFIKIFFTKWWIQNYFKELKFFKKIEKLSEKFFQNYELIWEKKSEEVKKFSKLKENISKLDEKILTNSKNFLEIKNAKNTLFKYYSKQEINFRDKLEENKKTMLLSLLETKKALLKQKNINQEINKKINFQISKEKYKNYSKSETISEKSDPYDINWFSDLDDKKFIWPIDKDRWITTKFLDPEYKKRFWIDHYWIDIRAKQWTSIHAPANAFVYKIHDWWKTWYSYIILAHKWKIQTVYWHISKFLCKEWDVILKWKIFAKTWWMPWSHWAGPLTTWPHLHLEFHDNWKAVDPMKFLN